MLQPGVISSTRNPRILDARRLTSRKHRRRQERFLVEGLQSLHMALDSDVQPRDVFHLERADLRPEPARLLDRFAASDARCQAVSPDVMAKLSERDAPAGIVATFRTPQRSLADADFDRDGLFVVLDRLQIPANIGTLIRTADAVGAAAVVTIEPGADPYDPAAVRSSMGSLFNLPLIQTDDVATLFGTLGRHGIRAVAADPHRGAEWGRGLWDARTALVLGNEARGLSDDVATHVDEYAQLPVVGKAESLNVAIAGGVLMYAWLEHNTSR